MNNKQRGYKGEENEGEHDEQSEKEHEERAKDGKLHEEEMELRVRLGRALKTTARDVLLLLYRQKFPRKNPNKTPIEVVNKINACRKFLQNNPAMEKKIRNNKDTKFDVSILYLLLKYTCGLSKKEEAWNSLSKLEGNIEILRNLRNEDAHSTQEESSLENLEKAWAEMEYAIINILNIAGFDDQINKYEDDLNNIRRGQIPSRVKPEDRVKEELLALYRESKKTSLQPLVWAGKEYTFHKAINKTYTPVRITTFVRGEVAEVDVAGVLASDGSRGGGGPRVTVIQGESGTGKTSLLRHLASCWADRTPSYLPAVNSMDFVLLMDLTAAAKGAFTISDVIQELLPRSCDEWHDSTIINVLSRAGNNVMIMIDAFDERFDAFNETFKHLLSKCPRATFLVTTRPHCTQNILNLCKQHCKVVTTHGFGRKTAVEYATKLLKINDKENELDEFIDAVSPYEEIITIPQLLCWCCWFWLEHGKDCFTTRRKIFASVTENLLKKMCHINGERVVAKEVPRKGQDWLDHMSDLALTLAQQDKTVLSHSCEEIKRLKKDARKLKLPPYEALSTLMQCDTRITSTQREFSFQFVHQSHASFLAAHRVANILYNNSRASVINILKKVKPKQKKLILLFLVGQLFDGNEEVSSKVLHELSSLAKEFVSFFDINFFLDLIEESKNNREFSQVLAKHMPRQNNKDQSLMITGSIKEKRKEMPQLWLRPKELRRKSPLVLLLREAKPTRVWLRLCEGPHNDELRYVPGHKAEEGDPDSALKLLAITYRDEILLELIITDCTFNSTPVWPKSISCLIFQRCEFNSHFSLPRSIDGVSLRDCKNIDNVDLYGCDANSISHQSCTSTQQPRLPGRLTASRNVDDQEEALGLHQMKKTGTNPAL